VDITDSTQAILNSHERVVEGFYERLLLSYPELRHHFQNRDLAMQASMVTMGLVSVEAYYTNKFPATEHYLRVLGHRHFHNGIRREDFPKFRDALLETLSVFHGDDWNDVLRQQWFDAIELSVSVMLEGYQRSYTY
jgi:hemoglobin-like flavoprotein